MLLLFDVDGTLISTGGVGIRAMGAAGRELFGPGFSESRTEFAGRLDPLIIDDLLRANTQQVSDENRSSMRAAYRKHLTAALQAPGTRRALPGVPELISSLVASNGAVVALLTGNFEDTGTLKLRACGIDDSSFSIRVWGDESPHNPPQREHLPAVAIARYRQFFRREIAPSRAIIIGDTPHDVACARANGCRSLAVATGSFSVERLLEAGADHAVQDLSSTQEVIETLLRLTMK
jgi:phosphoglycolate phosphatase